MIITTSWDDGHPLDIKLLELLEKYKIKATFYIPLSNSENQVMGKDIIKEISKYQEIGGHTVSHKYLNHLTDKESEYEIIQCKVQLENIISKQITAFCFPGGKYSKRDIDLLKKAGFLFGRTSALFHTYIDINQPIINTSIHVYNHEFYTLLFHCLIRNFLSPIFKYNFFIPYNRNYMQLAKDVFVEALNSKSIFHLWGHSWEIEKFNLWYDLEETFKMLKNETSALFLNNTECWKYKQKKI